MHYESYHWRDHAPDLHRRRVDLALTIAFALVFSFSGLGSIVSSRDGPQHAGAQPVTFQLALDAQQVADDGEAGHATCRG